MRLLRISVVAALVGLGLGGCASTDEDLTAQEEAEQHGTIVEEDGRIRRDVPNRTVAVLWDRAEKAREEGRLEDAIGSLERALRLTPEDPVLWSRAAELRLLQGRFAVAENLAAKSNALAGEEQRLLRYRNWLLIAESRERRDDKEGAEKARAEAARYNGS